MKKFVLVICSLVFFLACNNDSIDVQKTEETVSISQTDKLEFLLSKAIPIEGGYRISQQAQHHSISEIRYLNNGIFYVYAPEEGFTGIDLVKIKREDSNGATVFAETIITLHIKVSE